MIPLNTNGALGVIQLPSGTAVPTTAFYKAGLAFNGNGALYVVPITGAVPNTAEYTSGKAITPDGALYVRATTPAAYNAGVPLTADGAVCVTALGATVAGQFASQIGYVTGGKVCIAVPQILVDGNTVANYVRGLGQTNDGAGLCSAWANQIGAAGSLTAATTARPTIQADGSLLFDGSANKMQVATTLAQPETIYLVMSQVSWTNFNFICDGNHLGGAYLGALRQVTASPQIAAISDGAGAKTISITGPAIGVFGIITTIFNSTNSSLQLNSGTAATGDTGASDMSGFTLGCAGNLTAFSNIQVKELIIRNVADSAATQAKIRGYLKSIYGTP